MQALYGHEYKIVRNLLSIQKINDIVLRREGFWEQNVYSCINHLDGIETLGNSKVNLHIRELIEFAAQTLDYILYKLPDETELLSIIKELQYGSNKSKMYYDDLIDTSIRVKSNLTFNQKILFLFSAYAYDKPKEKNLINNRY